MTLKTVNNTPHVLINVRRLNHQYWSPLSLIISMKQVHALLYSPLFLFHTILYIGTLLNLYY